MDDEPLLMKRKERNEAEGLRSRGALGYEQTRAEPGGKLLQNGGKLNYVYVPIISERVRKKINKAR